MNEHLPPDPVEPAAAGDPAENDARSRDRVTDPLGTPQSRVVESVTLETGAKVPTDLSAVRDVSKTPILDESDASPGTPGLTKKERDALFRQIYDREFNYVWHSLRRFGVWDRDLEDAAHDAFVVIHRKLHTYDQDRPLKPWLVGIAFRIASDFRRRAQHRHEIVSDEIEAVDTAGDALQQIDARERRGLVRQALDTLDEDKRAVMVLHEIEGHTIVAVSEMLEVPLNTCYSRLRLARERFTSAVKRLQAQAQARGAPKQSGGQA